LHAVRNGHRTKKTFRHGRKIKSTITEGNVLVINLRKSRPWRAWFGWLYETTGSAHMVIGTTIKSKNPPQ
jgi:hypothetical protein